MSNTGPITVQSIDPDSGVWTNEVAVGTESVTLIARLPSGDVVIPASDPHDASSPDHWVRRHNGDWQHFTNLDAAPTHVLGFVELPNGDWFLAGSSPSESTQDGTVWRSTDHGATWTEVLRVPPASLVAPQDGDLRFCGLLPVGDTWLVLGSGSGMDPADAHRSWMWDLDTESAVQVADSLIPLTDPRTSVAIPGSRDGQAGIYILCMGPTSWPGFNDGTIWFQPTTDEALSGAPEMVAAPASSVCSDNAGGVYFTAYSADRIQRLSASGDLTILTYLNGVKPTSIARHPDGRLAVGGQSGRVAVITAST